MTLDGDDEPNLPAAAEGEDEQSKQSPPPKPKGKGKKSSSATGRQSSKRKASGKVSPALCSITDYSRRRRSHLLPTHLQKRRPRTMAKATTVRTTTLRPANHRTMTRHPRLPPATTTRTRKAMMIMAPSTLVRSPGHARHGPKIRGSRHCRPCTNASPQRLAQPLPSRLLHQSPLARSRLPVNTSPTRWPLSSASSSGTT